MEEIDKCIVALEKFRDTLVFTEDVAEVGRAISLLRLINKKIEATNESFFGGR